MVLRRLEVNLPRRASPAGAASARHSKKEQQAKWPGHEGEEQGRIRTQAKRVQAAGRHAPVNRSVQASMWIRPQRSRPGVHRLCNPIERHEIGRASCGFITGEANAQTMR